MIQIFDWEDLQNVKDDLTEDYVLMNNLDENTAGYSTYASSSANSGAGWLPIGNTYFSGTFDGQGYFIKGLFINRTSNNCGLFLAISGLVENLKIIDFNVTSTGQQIGGLCGTANNATIRDCVAIGKTNAGSFAGGMIGAVAGASDIDRCYSNTHAVATTSVAGGLTGWIQDSSTITDCFARGSAKCEAFVGGFVGFIADSTAVINRCYSTVSVIHSSVTSDGFSSNLGSGATVSNSYWDTETSRQSTSDTATGKTTSQMKTSGTFSGWDIVSGVDAGHVWGIDSSINYGYPFLQSLFADYDHYGVRVAASADDGYKNGSWDYTFASLTLGHWSGSNYQSAVRFLNIPMSSGTVISAFLNIRYTGDFDFGDDIGPVNVRIYGIYEDNTANFTSDPSGRTKTTAYVDWRIEIKEGTEQELVSPDLSKIVQEIVNRPGWDPNNAIGFIIQNNSSTQFASFVSYDGTTSEAAFLEISYLGITNTTRTLVSISRIINPERDYGIKIIKPTFELLTDNDPSHQIFNSDYNTLKYFASGTVQVTVDAFDNAAKEVFTHALTFFPYVEVYCRFDDVGDSFVYCPAVQHGATVTIEATYRITDNEVEFIVNTGGIASETNVTFKFFIFRNDLDL